MSNATLSQISGFPSAALNLLLDPKSWHPSPDRPVLRQPWLFPTTLSSFIVASLFPRKTRLWIGTSALLLVLGQLRTYSTGQASSDYGRTSFVFGFIMKWIDFAMMTKDGEIYKVKKRKVLKGGKEEWVEEKVEETGLWQKIKNSIDLWVFSMRGVNWNWRVQGIPPRDPQSKPYFLFRTALRLFGSYLALDICNLASAQFPYVHLNPHPSFFAQPPFVQFALTWLQKIDVFAQINILYQSLALIGVASSFQTPEDWPPVFGPLSESYLVGRFWGKTWHQLLRRPLSFLNPHVQRLLRVKSRAAKRTTLLFCTFFMSGLLHWTGVINVPWSPTASGTFTYFLMQAIVIRMEDYVLDFGKENGIKESRFLRFLGYLWTFCWISYSMRYAAAFLYEAGPLSTYRPLETSLVRLMLPKLVPVIRWYMRMRQTYWPS